MVRAGTRFELVAESELGEPCLSTPALAEGVIYFRTRSALVAVGAAAEDEQ